ncbi:MAG: DMT family transporter [Betaproteobacteria bacterium]|nr:DMT family transporter [Betaproteobacteria bacterium]
MRTAFFALIAGAVAIAFAPILVRFSEAGPVSTAFWRVLLSLPVAWGWMAWERRANPDATHVTDLKRLALSGLFFAGDLGIWHLSIVLTSVANSTLLVNMAPIFVTLGAWMLFRERITPVFLAGMALALAGSGLLVQASFALSAKQLAGDTLALVAALCYAGYLLAIKHLRDRGSTATIMAWSGTFTSIALLPAMLLSGEVMLPQSAGGWLVLVALALVCQIGGQSLITYALAHLPASFSSVSLLTQPVVAAFLAWALLAEAISPVQALGGIAVLAGIYLARSGTR